MNNMSSYWGLVDAKIRASDKDLPIGNLIDILMYDYGSVHLIFEVF